jgi:hypothetical protein
VEPEQLGELLAVRGVLVDAELDVLGELLGEDLVLVDEFPFVLDGCDLLLLFVLLLLLIDLLDLVLVLALNKLRVALTSLTANFFSKIECHVVNEPAEFL